MKTSHFSSFRSLLLMAAVMLVLDLIAINLLILPLFGQYLGDWLTPSPRLWAVGVFYVLYLAGVSFFAVQPAQNSAQALGRGAFLGLLAYGTYEFTNMATLQRWAVPMLLFDLLWGAALTAVVAWVGHKAR
ncbi:MAG: DUF2177 family protein [Anaerolineae bacterium]|nr:DUF2177 family protein [Anaerolineae bacterium]